MYLVECYGFSILKVRVYLWLWTRDIIVIKYEYELNRANQANVVLNNRRFGWQAPTRYLGG